MRRVLVTGGGGFLGRPCLTRLAAAGFEVHAVTRAADPVADAGAVTWHTGDLLAPGVPAMLVARVAPTHVLHLAWCTGHGDFWSSPENTAWVRATAELVEAGGAGDARVVSVGTCAEYDWGVGGVCVEDATPCRPHTVYGRAKHDASVHQQRVLATSGGGGVWARIFFPYGSGEPAARFVPSLVTRLLRGVEARCTTGAQVRDLLHVHDVAAALVRLLETDVRGAVNVGSGAGVRLRDVADAIGRLTGRADLLRLGALPTRADEPPVLVADTTRLARATGWTPALDLETGLRETIDWWRARAGCAETVTP